MGKKTDEIHQAFLNKAVDWIGTPFSRFSIELLNRLREQGALKEKTVARALGIYFNTSHPLFSSSIIRHIFHAALDMTYINHSIFPHDLLMHGPLPINVSSAPYILKKKISSPLKDIFMDELNALAINFNHLDPICLTYYPTPGHTQLALYIKEKWEATFNISITLQELDWNKLYSELSRGNFHVTECTESAFSKDPFDLLQRFEYPNSPYNYTGWSDPIFQTKIAAIRNACCVSERAQLVQEAEQCLYDGLPFIPVVNRKFIYATSPSLIDYVIDETGGLDFRWSKLRS